MKKTVDIQLNVQVWKDKETDTYIAFVPQLDVASCGRTIDEARKNIRDAIEGFLESAQDMGTLQEILDEAGFTFEDEWKAPEILLTERMRLAF